MNRLEFSIAWRYLRSRRGSNLLSFISLVSILGVMVAVSALILITGIMDGLQNDLREKILIGSPDIRILSWDQNLVLDKWQAVAKQAAAVKGVAAVAPFVNTQVLVQSAGQKYREGALVEGILPDGPGVPRTTSIRSHAVAGNFTFRASDGSHRGAVLGSRLAKRLNVVPGSDSIIIFTTNPNKINRATGYPTPITEVLEVTGIFETGLYDYDNSYVFVALDLAQQLAQLDSAVTGLEIRTPTRLDAERVALRLRDTLALNIVDWREQNASLFSALKLEKLGMTMILLLIVLVATFNIVSTLVMVVTEKTREIGILRAMGITARSIRRIFVAQGLVIGAVGTALGLLLGLAVSLLVGKAQLIRLDPSIYFIDHLPISVVPWNVVVIALASFGVSAVATIYPARQAARLFPVEAIRHE